MAKKKMFWLKMHKDFFKSKEIKKLRKISGGDTFTIIYLKMMLMSLESGGYIQYDGVEPTFAEELSLELDEATDDVKMTLVFLESMHLISEEKPHNFTLNHVAQIIGSETPQAGYMRKKRVEESQPLTNENVTQLQAVTKPLQQIESKSKIQSKSNTKDTTQDEACSDWYPFDEFWGVYGKKVDRKKCEAKYKKLGRIERAMISSHLPEYVLSCPNPQYRKNPLTYLNGECWNDEIIVSQEKPALDPDWMQDEFVQMSLQGDIERRNNANTTRNLLQ